MSSMPLAEIIQEMVDADKVHLPVHPGIAQEIAEVLAHEENGLDQIWSLAGRDPALSCNLFRAANSSFFAGLKRTLSIDEVVTRLGQDKVLEVIESACQKGRSCPQGQLTPEYMPTLWQHSQGCAEGARWLAERCGYVRLADQAYMAGLLHDIGKQFLLSVLEEITSRDELGITLTRQLVHEVLETMHVEQGLRMFKEWNLSEIYQEVIAEHHGTNLETQNIIVPLVKLANKGCSKVGLGLNQQADLILPTTAEAQFLGIDEISLAEFEIMLEDRFLDGQATTKIT